MPHSLPRTLAGDLELGLATSLADRKEVLECHREVFGDDEIEPIRAHMFDRPQKAGDALLYVKDRASGKIVSSVSLDLQVWTYEGIPLSVAEAGIVGTREPYRKRGLVREQFDAYHRLAAGVGCVISVIQGIGYFYRQFGYQFVFPLGQGATLQADRVPDLAEGRQERFLIRPSRAEDAQLLQRFYAKLTRGLCVVSVIPQDIWSYQDGLSEDCGAGKATFVVEEQGRPCGFVRMNANERGWDKGVRIRAAYLPTREMSMAAMRHAKRLAIEERKEHTITVDLLMSTPLRQLADDLGALAKRSYGWQVRILDPVAFLMAIAPELERRIAESPWVGLTKEYTVGVFREVFVLRFRKGRITGVSTLPRASDRDLTCPPDAIPLLWMGRRSIEEILDWYPDAASKSKASQRLTDVLFPRRESWICSLF